jgi:hypothetical protein
MGQIGKRRGSAQSGHIQLPLRLRGIAQAGLWDAVAISGLAFAEEELEARVDE